RPELLRVRDEPDPRRMIELYAVLIAGIGKRLSGIYEVFRAASGSDPDIGALWREIQAQRLQGARGFVSILSTKTTLRDGLDPEVAGDIVWTLIDASLYQRLCRDRGWPHARFELWLSDALTAQLLSSSPERWGAAQRAAAV